MGREAQSGDSLRESPRGALGEALAFRIPPGLPEVASPAPVPHSEHIPEGGLGGAKARPGGFEPQRL